MGSRGSWCGVVAQCHSVPEALRDSDGRPAPGWGLGQKGEQEEFAEQALGRKCSPVSRKACPNQQALTWLGAAGARVIHV